MTRKIKSRSESSFFTIFLPRLARKINCGKYSCFAVLFSVISRVSRETILLLALLSSASATELYHTNRTFSPVEFNIQGTPTADQLNKEAKKLTDIAPGAPVKITSTNAIERQIIVGLGYDSGTSAWNAAKSYPAQTRQYPGKIFDNAGWVRGTKQVGTNWGAFIWTMQNQITFRSSETNKWPFGGGKVLITNVIVGSLGNYQPMVSVADTGPKLDAAYNTYPGDNQGDEGNYQVDLTTYYQLAIPDISVTPKEAVAAVGGPAVRFTATGTNIPSGVTWSIIPSGVLSGAVLQAAGYSADVTPGTVPMIYQIFAISVDCPNLYDEAKLTVVIPTVEIVSVDATDDIGPTKINYRIIPSGVSIPSMTFTAPGMTETRVNVSGDFYFTYNQSDLPYGASTIRLSYLGRNADLMVNKEGVGKGPAVEIVIATIPVDPGWVHWPISHQLTEVYAKITYTGAPVLAGSHTLYVGASHVMLEAATTVTIDWAYEKHRYHDNDGTHNDQAMTLYTGGPTIPPTTAFRKFYESIDNKFFKPGNGLEGIAQLESVKLDGILPLNLANEDVDQNLE